MFGRRAALVLLSVTTFVINAFPAHAITRVAAREYGLQVTHTELSRIPLDAGSEGLELSISITNSGTHDLSDVRLYVVRAGSKAIIDRSEPARVAKLSAGGNSVVTWVFDPKQPISGPLRTVVFRIEAIDDATKDIVTFSQQSLEAR